MVGSNGKPPEAVNTLYKSLVPNFGYPIPAIVPRYYLKDLRLSKNFPHDWVKTRYLVRFFSNQQARKNLFYFVIKHNAEQAKIGHDLIF